MHYHTRWFHKFSLLNIHLGVSVYTCIFKIDIWNRKKSSLSYYPITDIDECQPVPCVHGNCIDDINSYSCSCEIGYTGDNCEIGKYNHELLYYVCRLNIKQLAMKKQYMI